MDKKEKGTKMDRRGFLTRTAAAAGAGAILAGGLSNAVAATATTKTRTGKVDDLNVGIIGIGSQGHVLLTSCLKAGQSIPGLRFKAVCDIWKFNRDKGVNTLNAYNKLKGFGAVKEFFDYKEMLKDETLDLDAVIVATPDWLHAEHSVACMKAGLHVYCEKEMSNSLELAKQMVLTSRETKKLLQIGHQRRSNPRYLHAINNCILDSKMLGRVMQGYGQWNRAVSDDIGWPQKHALTAGELAKSGYDTMSRFRNWRWYKRYGGGPIVDLGSHQIDIYNWFLGARPKSVIAHGSTNYFDSKTRQWHDNVMAIYEYETAHGPVSAFYQTIATNSSNGYFETFMGNEGTLVISESIGRTGVYPEPYNPEGHWDKWVKAGYIDPPKEEPKPEPKITEALDIRESVRPPKYLLPLDFREKYHQPHLENFFNAVRGKGKLNCPAEIGYETAVAVLKVNEAIAADKKLNFEPGEFTI